MDKLSSGVSLAGLYSTLLDSKRANIAAKDKAALLEESQKPIQSAIKTTPNDNYSASYIGDFVKVAFEDERSKQLVSVNLSTRNLLRLISHFGGENNFFVRNDGVVRLNGDAQNFVSGWFDKVAYEMNLLGADTDKNGLISGDELANTFFYENPYVYGNAKKAEDVSIYTLTGGAKIAYDESDLRGVQIERVIDGSLNALLDGDKNMDGKITFVEHFGGKMMALGSVEMELKGGSNAGFNPFEFMLEELKKMLEELQQKLQKGLKSADKLKEKAATQGLQALNSMELELLKSQNPLDYERLKNGQNVALSGQNGAKNLGENLNLNEQNSALSSENLNLNEKKTRLSNQTQSDKNALNLSPQAEFDEQINKTGSESAEFKNENATNQNANFVSQNTTFTNQSTQFSRQNSNFASQSAKFQSENAEFKNENATNQNAQFTNKNKPLTKDLRQINELLSVLNNAANKSLLSSQSQNKLKALENLHSLASSLSKDLRAQIQAKSIKIVDFRV